MHVSSAGHADFLSGAGNGMIENGRPYSLNQDLDVPAMVSSDNAISGTTEVVTDKNGLLLQKICSIVSTLAIRNFMPSICFSFFG